MKRYLYDAAGVFVREVDGPTYPKNTTKFPPPEVEANEFAVWRGGWSVVSNRPEFIPKRVTAMQAEIAMVDAGIFDDVEAYIDGLNKKDPRSIAYKKTNYFVYGHPMILDIQSALNLTQEQVDNLFIAAARVQ